MFGHVDTRNPGEVAKVVQAIHLSVCPGAEPAFVPRAIEWAQHCFSGEYPGYQPIDARYHDFEHTLQGALCLARLLRGRHRACALPALSAAEFELCLLAMLFHDTGYLKTSDDAEGTGAKYTATHVTRSAEFAQEFLARQGYSHWETLAVENMICCTGINADLRQIQFQSETERIAGCALATADLLGQMAAPDYIDKLPALFEEFSEAAAFMGGTALLHRFHSVEDLLKNTPRFWTDYVWPRLHHEFGGVYRFLNDPFPDGPNEYLARIQANLEKLQP